MGLLPVLWIYGPPGVGKSTVAWELFAQHPGPVGYVDIDQLGMCYGAPTAEEWSPEPADDPGRYLRKERNLAAIVDNFHRAGARGLIVSGIVDSVRGIDFDLFRHVALKPLRLRCEPAELVRRLGERNRAGDRLDEIADYAEQMDRGDLPGDCIDSTGLDKTKTVDAVRDHLRDWPPDSGTDGAANGAANGAAVTVPGEIVWLCGPAAVGKSTAGWETYMQSRLAGAHTAFLDLQQIGFLRPEPADDHRLKAANLAAIWRTYYEAGARRLVVVGSVEHPDQVALYRAALPGATVTVCHLRAGLRRLTERTLLRGQGQGPPIAGDTLAGRPPAELRRRAAAAHARDQAVAGEPAPDTEARDHAPGRDRGVPSAGRRPACTRTAVGDLEIDTDGQTPADTAAEILKRISAPPPGTGPRSPGARAT
ncbi:AAA family ATPase [Paractinoplanes rishiriensis]|nr:AAA family ATPase [Actinoplanes rishiriensis]